MGGRSVAEELINRSQGVTVVVVDAESQERVAVPANSAAAGGAKLAVAGGGTLSRMMDESRIIIWNDSVSQEELRRKLVDCVVASTAGLKAQTVLRKLAERESQGSTFLNEGVALPHARLDELMSPQVALGLTHSGVLDAPTEKPIEAVFLLLSPTSGANVYLQLLAKVGRALQSRELRRALNEAQTPGEALGAIQDYEAAVSGK
jgi:PTS system nitrogen regulatory IIA component